MKFRFPLALFTAATIMFGSACQGHVDPVTPEDPDTGGTETPDYGEGDGSGLVIATDLSIIQVGVSSAAITATLNGFEIPDTENIKFYDSSNARMTIENMTFSPSEAGTYSFWAAYGVNTSNRVTVTAINSPVPDMPADPQPASTDFFRKMLLVQHTGTGCMYCPYMSAQLRALSGTEYAGDYVLTAAHSRNDGDPMYRSDMGRLAEASGIGVSSNGPGWPSLVMDQYLIYQLTNTTISPTDLEYYFSIAYNRTDALAGLAVSSLVDEKAIIVRSSVKAVNTGNYRIGAMILEDGIYAPQRDALSEEDNTHNNVIRALDARSGSRYYGLSLGTIEAGEEADHVFIFDIEDEWVLDNCHIAVFVSTEEADGELRVNNAATCELNGTTAYQYN